MSTGEVAKKFGISEPYLQGLIRRRKLTPVPPMVNGRRKWSPRHVAAVAVALGRNGS